MLAYSKIPLNSIVKWSKTNMSLLENKFEYLCHPATKHELIEELRFTDEFYTYTTLGRVEIRPKSLVKDLGVNIASGLSWTPQTNTTLDSVEKWFHCGLVYL